jgi:hypothetical protein
MLLATSEPYVAPCVTELQACNVHTVLTGQTRGLRNAFYVRLTFKRKLGQHSHDNCLQIMLVYAARRHD